MCSAGAVDAYFLTNNGSQIVKVNTSALANREIEHAELETIFFYYFTSFRRFRPAPQMRVLSANYESEVDKVTTCFVESWSVI